MTVQEEREHLMKLKEDGQYNLFDHLDNHPVARLVALGAHLSDDHPLTILKRMKDDTKSN